MCACRIGSRFRLLLHSTCLTIDGRKSGREYVRSPLTEDRKMDRDTVCREEDERGPSIHSKANLCFQIGSVWATEWRRQRQSQWEEGSSIFLVLSSSSCFGRGRVRYHCFSGPPLPSVLCCPRETRKWVARFFPERAS